jgi:CDGSH-type Zn-finger protein
MRFLQSGIGLGSPLGEVHDATRKRRRFREMSEKVKITVRDNGSLKVQGEFEIVDVEGNVIPHEGDSTGLCRCGHSANKPFCDGSHKEKFESVVRAPEKA